MYKRMPRVPIANHSEKGLEIGMTSPATLRTTNGGTI